MSVHRIRLRGPWHYEWLAGEAPFPPKGRVSLPQAWSELFGNNAGRVRFQRTFHCPTNLEPASQVNLIFEGIGGESRVTLNDKELAQTVVDSEAGTSPRFDITEHLRPTNDLRVEIHHQFEHGQTPGGLWGMVVLEIVE